MCCFGRAVVLYSSVSFDGFANSSRNTTPVFLEKRRAVEGGGPTTPASSPMQTKFQFFNKT
jgi:hypothetical protein